MARRHAVRRRPRPAIVLGYGVDGHVVRVTVVPPDTVEVEVRISDPAGDVTGVAAARAEAGS